MVGPDVKCFFHEATFTCAYVVRDPGSTAAMIVDPALDYDASTGRTGTAFADRLVAYAQESGLDIQWIAETHAHADHLTAAPYLRQRLGGRIAIGEGIRAVQEVFKARFNLPDLKPDGSQFDRLFQEGERFALGDLEVEVLSTPGHTNDSVSYHVGHALFVGDTLFAPDYGTARADFPGGDARQLYRSIRRLLSFPADTRLYLCHDYMPGGRELEYVHTVAQQRAENIHVHEGVAEDVFVKMREERDAGLSLPALIIPAVQVNIRAGQLPPAEDNGVSYLKVPVDVFG